MRTVWSVTTLSSCLVALAVMSSGRESKAADANGYPYGETTCLQGNSGMGCDFS